MDQPDVRSKVNHRNESTEDRKRVSNTGVFLTPIQKIPPEVWENVFDNLVESVDLLNASHAVNLWYDILHPSKKTWLFVQIFPFLLEYFSKKDVFTCRLVCQKWFSAVDNFLTENSFQRPASSESRTHLLETKRNQYKTDERIYPIDKLLRSLDLRYNPVKRLKDVAFSSSLSPKNLAIVGRSVMISEERINSRTPVNKTTNVQFLERFGHQIQFLRITLDNIAYFFSVIQHVPNLKKLDFVYLNTCLTREQLNQQVSNFMTTRPLSEIKSLLPKCLETLRIYTMRDDQYAIPQFLLSLLADQLESLKITAATPPPLQQFPRQIVDLSIAIRENYHWDFFKCLAHCPLRRLMLHIFGNRANIRLIKIVLTKFQSSLRNLELHFTDEIKELTYNPIHFQVFAQDRLQLPNLLRLTLKDNIPPSLNFISDLKTLQHFHFFVGNHAKGEPRKMQRMVNERMNKGIEELDILKTLFGILMKAEELENWECALKYLGKNILSLYDSNVWKIFPKLKVLTVLFKVRVNGSENCTQRINCHEETKEYELRRDIYEKFRNKNYTCVK